MIRSLKALLILFFCFATPLCFSASGIPKDSAPHQRNLILDFDGTLADSMNNFLAAFNSLAPRYGLSIISPRERETVRSISAYDLLRRQGIWLYQIPFFIADLKSALKTHTAAQIAHLKAHKGLVELIQRLHAQKYQLFIMSSSELAPIKIFLKRHGIDGCFKDIFPASDSDSPYKATKLISLMRKHGLAPSTTLYIGDEQRDIDAALEAPIPIIAVSWGFNTKSFLEKSKPTYVVDTASELESTIEKHFAKK